MQIQPRYLKLWWFLYFINEKYDKNVKVEKLTKTLGRGVRLIVIGPLNYIKCLRVMLGLIYFQTGSPLVMVIVWYIAYSPFSQSEWPIIMTKQLLIFCEWCSHRLIRSIRVLSGLENIKRAFSWLWSCLVVPLAVCSCHENLNWVWICGKSLN